MPLRFRTVKAILDTLEQRYGHTPVALVGLSLGGYFAARAAAHDDRIAAVIASTPYPRPAELFASRAVGAVAETAAGRRNLGNLLWKAGAGTLDELVEIMQGWVADPALVRCPFLSVAGSSESPILLRQAQQWHEALDVPHKRIAILGPGTGADAH